MVILNPPIRPCGEIVTLSSRSSHPKQYASFEKNWQCSFQRGVELFNCKRTTTDDYRLIPIPTDHLRECLRWPKKRNSQRRGTLQVKSNCKQCQQLIIRCCKCFKKIYNYMHYTKLTFYHLYSLVHFLRKCQQEHTVSFELQINLNVRWIHT